MKRLAEGAGGGVGCGVNMEELLQLACLWGMILCGALSLWPFRFAQRWRSWNLYLPVAAILMYGVFDFAAPLEMDPQTRAEMKVVVPLLLFIWLNGMTKVALLSILAPKAGGSRRRLRGMPQRKTQLMLALPILVVCLLWGWMTWA